MDLISAFILVVNIATLIDICVKVVGVYKDGLSVNNARLAETAGEMKDLWQRLKDAPLLKQPTISGSLETNLQDCARRCIEKAAALRKELDLPAASNSRRQRAAKSVRLLFSRKVSQLEQDLRDLKAELDTKLLVSLRDKIDFSGVEQKDHSKALDASIQNLFVRFRDSQTKSWELVLDRNTGRILDSIDDIRKKQIEDETRRDLKQRKNIILDSLLYGNPFTRKNDILSKHDGTFEWIIDENSGSAFSSWIKSDNGIFWIQGKPGSGKSTLMKFISGNRVAKFLRQSVSAKTPLIISFYFWLADSVKMQNTEKGLLCFLLAQFLESHWPLDSSYLTDVKLRQKKTQGKWDLPELRSLLLIAVDKVFEHQSVFIFIDALDECQADDLSGVIDIIKVLSEHGVKVCVSSRLEQRILKRLELIAAEALRIDLHTKGDIANFVNDIFGTIYLDPEILSGNELGQLAWLIIDHADGVFLWATLAAKDVLRGINSGDHFDQLYQRANQLPSDINALYKDAQATHIGAQFAFSIDTPNGARYSFATREIFAKCNASDGYLKVWLFY
ncbi:uncharacterized protein KD926_006796 [Aspergillus affinis]|uniref:uncharacterized protein n=1 Tax=Aspergillus affinis TaxID=1070780 RepID=UPI0022FDB7AB|nr:uncharacterized protein KD926_006796 [Aspergillus affinis]KAI9041400.1 hypothetical protein KD926_006796 [Aspergillus affinis]